ncbi:MAG: Mut7-C RNAse domain-containing protein [Chloroflexota bacterium]
MAHASFHFHGEVNDFLPKQRRDRSFTYTFNWKASIKDMVESLGPPHPEIEALTIDGAAVGFEAIVEPGTKIDVYARASTANVPLSARTTPPPPLPPRFVLDTHLGRLANYLRMSGFDTLYRNDYPDDELAAISAEEDRILLTRDIGLLKRGIVTYGRFIRQTNPRRQIIEVLRRWNLEQHVTPFRRCLRCNGPLHAVPKSEVRSRVPESSLRHYDEFHECSVCGQVYWKGSHFDKMRAFMAEVVEEQPGL